MGYIEKYIICKKDHGDFGNIGDLSSFCRKHDIENNIGDFGNSGDFNNKQKNNEYL